MKNWKESKEKLKKVKHKLIRRYLWYRYYNRFRHHQMRLLASKIALIYNPKLDLDNLLKLELAMLEVASEKKLTMFVPIFEEIGSLVNIEADWEAFGKFIFYIYQTSTFYRDRFYKRKNIYTRQNLIQENAKKRNYFYSWMHSLDIHIPDFNAKFVLVQKAVF